MIDIMPGESYDYDFQIPLDQPPGLAWYTRITTDPPRCRP